MILKAILIMLPTFLSFCFGLALLLIGSHYLVCASVSIAKNYNISPFIVGTFLIGFGTSIPEFLVSANALWHGSVDLCIGNALGSYISNIGMVLGFSALVRPIAIPMNVLQQELPLLFIALLITIFLVLDGHLSVPDSSILLALFVIFSIVSVSSSTADNTTSHEDGDNTSVWWIFIQFIFFLSLLLIGSDMLVVSAQSIAKSMGLSELVIGLSMVAVGTSLPELATALMSLAHKEDELCVGNIIGSNIFCLLGILPLPAIATLESIGTENLWREFSVMVVMTMLFWLFAAKFDEHKQINRIEGSVLLLSFIVYLATLFS